MAGQSHVFSKFLFQLGSPLILVTAPRIGWALLLPNVMEIEAFSLCCFYQSSRVVPHGTKRALALSSSQDQCARAPSSGTTPTQITLIL